MAEVKVPLRKLGQSNLFISALGLGCWQFSNGKGLVGRFWPAMNQEEVLEIVKVSLNGGINWFDTAEVYGKGESEEALAGALNQLGEQAEHAIVATKWWPVFRRADSITKTIENRLNALKGHEIDLYQIHQPYSFSSIKKQMDEMAKLLKAKKVHHVGVSNFNEKQMREAHQVLKGHGYLLTSNQVKYSLLDRRIEENGVLATAKELGITIIAYSPLEQGILTGKFHKNPELIKSSKGPRKYLAQFKQSGLDKTKPLIDLLEELAQKYQVTASQIALNWMIHFHGDTVVAIPGASKVKHAEENIGALTFKLTEEELNLIDAVSKQVNDKKRS